MILRKILETAFLTGEMIGDEKDDCTLLLSAASNRQETGYHFDEEVVDTFADGHDSDDEIPSMNQALSKVSLGQLPTTISHPSFTLGEGKTANSNLCRAPREKLITVLKESEKLLRSTRPALPKVSPAPRKLDNFILSLKEQREHAKVGEEAARSAHSKLLAILPERVARLTPQLSADSRPQDELEIILEEDQGKRDKSSRTLRIVRKSIAPKLKKASISKLNEQLDVEIRRQHQLAEGERATAKKSTSGAIVTGRSEDGEEEEEFGVEEEDGDYEEAEEDEQNESKYSDFEYRAVKNKFCCVESEEDKDNKKVEWAEKKNAGKPLRRLPITIEEEEEQKGKGKDDDDDNKEMPGKGDGLLGKAFKKKAADKDETDLTNDLIDELIDSDDHDETSLRRVSIDEKDLGLMLSGNFPPGRGGEGEESEREEEEEEEEDGDDMGTEEEGEDDDYNVGDDDVDVAGEIAFRRADFVRGLIDEEAEDEDSEVSADDIDEEAIARELHESAFLNDDEELEESNESTQSQRALLRRMRDAEEADELAMFMNRFVPDEVLREMGPLAELRKKYADRRDDYDEGLGGEEPSGPGLLQSTFGQVSRFKVQPGRSHPEFLKLLEQDRLSSETEPESADEDDFIGEEEDDVEVGDKVEGTFEQKTTLDSLVGDSLLSVEVVAKTASFTSKAKRAPTGFPLNVGDSLWGRLAPGVGGAVRDDDGHGASGKRARTTFETVSARPVLPTDKRK